MMCPPRLFVTVLLALLPASSWAGQAAPAGTPPVRRPAAPPAGQFDAVAKRATAAREANRLDEAVKLYEQAVKLRPTWVEGHWYLGTIHYEVDRYAPARDAFRRVAAAQPDNGAAHAMKGLCEFRLKNYDTALSDLLRAGDLGVGDNRELSASVRYHAAILMTRHEQFEFAMQQLEPIAQQGNESPSVIEAFGLATLRIPLLPAELQPDRREMVLLAGRASYYQAIRVPAAAQRAFEELVRRYPDAPNTHYALGAFLISQTQADRAIEAFKKELELSPGHIPSIVQIAFEYIKQSNWDAARPWAKEAVTLAPNDFTARRAYGQVLLETGDTDGAIAEFERGVALAEDSPSMRFALARAYQKAGRTADAERERAEFRRLERQIRGGRHGEQAVGGVSEPTAPNPD